MIKSIRRLWWTYVLSQHELLEQYSRKHTNVVFGRMVSGRYRPRRPMWTLFVEPIGSPHVDRGQTHVERGYQKHTRAGDHGITKIPVSHKQKRAKGTSRWNLAANIVGSLKRCCDSSMS